MVNKICIYAICKNEIKFVDKWLDSMSEADYIVVLDTGSTDGTYEKLKSDPRVTRVEQKKIKPWRFDKARNASLKLVPDDANILFCTDLDELLEPGWGDLIRNNWTEHTTRGHYRYVWSHTSAGNPGLTFWYDKMHSKDYKWYYPVHEVLGGLDCQEGMDTREKSGSLIDFGDAITLHHYPDNTKSRSNYLKLLELREEENPDEAYSAYLLGREYAVYQQYDKALEMFDKTLSLPDVNHKPLVKYIVLGYEGDIYRLKGDVLTAITCYSSQIVEDSTYREPYIELADLYNQLGLYHISLGYSEEALTRSYQHFDWTEREATWNEKPCDVLSVTYFRLGELDLALENVVRAMQLNPKDQRIQRNYLAILEKKREQANQN